jgi:hypothetical protein
VTAETCLVSGAVRVGGAHRDDEELKAAQRGVIDGANAVGNRAAGRGVKNKRELFDVPSAAAFADLHERQRCGRVLRRLKEERRPQQCTELCGRRLIEAEGARDDGRRSDTSRRTEGVDQTRIHTGADDRQTAYFEKTGTRDSHNFSPAVICRRSPGEAEGA